jgi:predicted nucleotidyltransferase
LRYIPGLRAVYVCNTLAFGTLGRDSDIDLCIVTASGRLWFVRAWANILLKATGLRVGKRGSEKRCCLSFFIAEDAESLARIAIEDDVYLAMWLFHLIAVYDPDNHRVGYADQHRVWGEQILQTSWDGIDAHAWAYLYGKPWITRWVELLIPHICWRWAEWFAEYAQRFILDNEINMRAMDTSQTGVVLSDQMLKFHMTDTRDQVRHAWKHMQSKEI